MNLQMTLLQSIKGSNGVAFYLYIIYLSICLSIYLFIYLSINIMYMVFTTERFLEVVIESWPEWNLDPQPLNSVQTPITD